MTKRIRRTLIGLTTSLAFMVALASVQPVTAALDCTDLVGCRGAASCTNGGDPDNCVIECTGGGTVICELA